MTTLWIWLLVLGYSQAFVVPHTTRPASRLYGLFPERPSSGRRATKALPRRTNTTTTTSAATLSSPPTINGISLQVPLSNQTLQFRNETIPGIGGDGGIVYDVNRLKRNLLQETIREYKRELWYLLQSPSSTEEAIADKLSALVESSAVRTTTDSNLLDGTWTLAYTSKFATVEGLRAVRPRFPLRSRLRKRRQEQDAAAPLTPVQRRRGGKERLLSTRQRTFYLEDLEEDEDPHILDERRWLGGLLTRQRRLTVGGLTRQSLLLERLTTEWCFMGRKVASTEDEKTADVQVVYLDVDLAILAEAGSPLFYVYTKQDAWIDPRLRTRRKLRYLLDAAKGLVFRKGKEVSVINWRSPEEHVNQILLQIEADNARLRVLKLGDVENRDDESWDGLSDPFVHLSADDRQTVLKTMNVRDIAKAGNKRLAVSKRERWFQALLRRRRKSGFVFKDRK